MTQSLTPLSDKAIREDWPKFAAMLEREVRKPDRLPEFLGLLQRRLMAGCETYGDTSFLQPAMKSIGEAKMEQLDTVGWLFVANTIIDAGPLDESAKKELRFHLFEVCLDAYRQYRYLCEIEETLKSLQKNAA